MKGCETAKQCQLQMAYTGHGHVGVHARLQKRQRSNFTGMIQYRKHQGFGFSLIAVIALDSALIVSSSATVASRSNSMALTKWFGGVPGSGGISAAATASEQTKTTPCSGDY